jgi:hypothetical protein
MKQEPAMADDRDSDKGVHPGTPLTVDERKALLERAVFDETREVRATLKSQGEFEATLVRSNAVNHGLHLRVVVVVAVVAVLVSQLFGTGLWGLKVALVVPGLYTLWWAFLTMTSGDELQHLAVDDQGTVTSVRSGMSIELRGDILRIAIPLIVIVVCGWLVVGLVRDIAHPPPPDCNVPVTDQPDSCLSLSFMGSAVVGQYVATPTPAPSHTPAPSASPSASPAASPAATPTASGSHTQGFSVSQTIALERMIRGFQLLIVLVMFLGAGWFLRRMLTGQWVAYVRPVRHRAEE